MEAQSDHWNEIFRKTDDEQLGWYEKDFSQSLKILNLIPDWKSSRIFVPGIGTSGIIELFSATDAELVFNDISSEAIEKAKNRYHGKASRVQWLCRDIAKPLPPDLTGIGIWFDRAVLHFLVEDDHIEQYFKNVDMAVKPGGYAIFAEFSKTGATKCAGLDVRRYDVQDMIRHLGMFEPVFSEEYVYINPWGDPKPYIYALLRRKNG